MVEFVICGVERGTWQINVCGKTGGKKLAVSVTCEGLRVRHEYAYHFGKGEDDFL
jgi:hypothetical protein